MSVNENLPPPPEPFDRRQGGASSQWVRDAFKEQSGKIDKIAEDVHDINVALQRSWKNNDPSTHWDEHELFRERELERQRLEAKRVEEETKRREFWEKIKADVMSYALKAAGLFIVGVIVLGSQAKFKEWVQWAVADDKKVEATK